MSKRNHLREYVFSLQVHFHANQTNLHMKGFVRGHVFKPEAQGRLEMAKRYRNDPAGETLAMITESDLCFDKSLCEFS